MTSAQGGYTPVHRWVKHVLGHAAGVARGVARQRPGGSEAGGRARPQHAPPPGRRQKAV